jgi:hypothetical protein
MARLLENLFPVLITILLSALIAYAAWATQQIHANDVAIIQYKLDVDKEVSTLRTDVVERLKCIETNQGHIKATLERFERLLGQRKVVTQ